MKTYLNKKIPGETKVMRKRILEHYQGVPEKRIEAGVYLRKVGRDYIHVLNTWERARIQRIPIEKFYRRYFLGIDECYSD